MTALTCPVCDMEWPTEPLNCLCGYSFEARDPARAIPIVQRRLAAANRHVLGGVLTLASIPFGFAIGLPGVLLVVAFPIQLLVGASIVMRGASRHGRERRRLRAAKRLRQLPAARIVLPR